MPRSPAHTPAGISLHLIPCRSTPKRTDPGCGPQQVEQAFDGGGLAGAIAAEEPIAFASPHPQAQIVDGLRAAILVDQMGDLDNGRFLVHSCSFALASWALFVCFEYFQPLLDQGQKVLLLHAQVVRLHNRGINLLGHHLQPDLLPEGRIVLFQKAAPSGDGLNDPLPFELGVGLGDGIPVDAQLLR